MKASESQRLRVPKKKFVPDFKRGKTKTHEEIERDTKNFLNSGGAITIVPAGETGADNFVTYPNRKTRNGKTTKK